MLDSKFLRENLETVEARLKTRGGTVDLGGFRTLDTRRRELLRQSEELKALRNRVSEEISRIRDKSQAQVQIAEMREVGVRIRALDEELKGVDEELELFLLTVPNIPSLQCRSAHPKRTMSRSGNGGKSRSFPSPRNRTGKSARHWGSSILSGAPSLQAPGLPSIKERARDWNGHSLTLCSTSIRSGTIILKCSLPLW